MESKVWTFTVFVFNSETKEIELKIKCKTNKTTLEKARALAKREVEKAKSPACFHIEGTW